RRDAGARRRRRGRGSPGAARLGAGLSAGPSRARGGRGAHRGAPRRSCGCRARAGAPLRLARVDRPPLHGLYGSDPATESGYPEPVVSVVQDPAFEGERVTVLRARRGWAALDLRELWDYRELLYFLVWRDVKIRYKQTAIGAAWVILQPLLQAAIFTIVFGHFAHLTTNGTPYLVLTYSALLPWLLFANALSRSTKGIVEHQA